MCGLIMCVYKLCKTLLIPWGNLIHDEFINMKCNAKNLQFQFKLWVSHFNAKAFMVERTKVWRHHFFSSFFAFQHYHDQALVETDEKCLHAKFDMGEKCLWRHHFCDLYTFFFLNMLSFDSNLTGIILYVTYKQKLTLGIMQDQRSSCV